MAPLLVGAVSSLATRGLGADYAVARAPWPLAIGAVLATVARPRAIYEADDRCRRRDPPEDVERRVDRAVGFIGVRLLHGLSKLTRTRASSRAWAPHHTRRGQIARR